MVNATVNISQNIGKIIRQLGGTGKIQMQSRIISIGTEIQSNGILMLLQIVVGQSVILRKCGNLAVILLVPVGIAARCLDQDQFNTMLAPFLYTLYA